MNDLKIAIITVAGISSRFNKDVPEDEKVLKCLYWEDKPRNTLIYHLIKKVSAYDKIIIVGGFKFQDLIDYISKNISQTLKDKIMIFNNSHYKDLSSGYSLYIGIKEALNFENIEEILFVEGDLDIDEDSFLKVLNSNKNVLTINRNPIYSNKSVVLYQDKNDDYHYLFSSDHGLLTLEEPFKAIFNSGQIWKFKNVELLKIATNYFKENIIGDTNLGIIQKYFALVENKEIEIIELKHWVNCNTHEDYKLIKDYWGE